MRGAVLTVSDGVHAGARVDLSGDALDELLQSEGFEVSRVVVPDEAEAIAGAIRELADGGALLVLTTEGRASPRVT